MRNEKGEITIASVWKWLRSDKGKKYSFFVFYIFFFIFVFIVLSFTNNNQMIDNNTLKEEQSSLPYSLKNIEDTTYEFYYTVDINSSLQEFLGNKNNNTITIQDDTGTYIYFYQDGNLTFQGELNPLTYPEFLDIYELKRVIKNAKLVSETKMADTNEYIYTYTIKTSALSDLLDDNVQISKDLDNQITIKTDSKKEFQTITLNILNYVKEIENSDVKITNYDITLTYGDNNE